jgi:hypothetical protein
MGRQARRRRTAAAAAAAGAKAPPRRRPRVAARLQRRLHRVSRRYPAAVVASLVLLHVALALLTFEPRPHTGGDNAAYISLGTSLLERGTYQELWDPAEPPHTKYPPGFPVILAVAMALGLQPWVQLKFVVLGFSAAATALSFLWIRSRGRATMALVIGALLAVAPGILREGRWILSDVPFWAFTMLALWALERLRPGRWARLAVGATAVTAAYMTRSAGLPLVVAAAAWFAWRRRWHELGALAAVVGIPAALWWLRSRAFTAGGYVSEFWLVDPYQPALGTVGAGDLVARVLANLEKYVSTHFPVLMHGSTGFLPLLVSIAVFALAAYGWARRIRRPALAELFLPLYLGLIFLWPAVWSGERFLLPALPLVLFFAGEGLVRLVRSVAARYDFAAGAGAAGLVLLLALPALAAGLAVGRECTGRYLAGERYPCLGAPVWDDFFALAETTGAALPDGAVVLNRKPRLYYVLSGLHARNYPLSDDPAAFFAAADSAGARYVVFDRLDAVSDYYLQPVLARHAGAFCLMAVRPATGTGLFGIAAPGDVARAGPGELNEAGQVVFPLCGPEYWRDAAAMELYGVQ